MGKKTQEVTNNLMSFAKALPLILGSLGGLVISAGPARGSPLNSLFKDKNPQWAANDLAATYLFFDAGKSNEFKGDLGNGAKLLAGGIIVHKLIAWIDG
jgi:hypothetical protein